MATGLEGLLALGAVGAALVVLVGILLVFAPLGIWYNLAKMVKLQGKSLDAFVASQDAQTEALGAIAIAIEGQVASLQLQLEAIKADTASANAALGELELVDAPGNVDEDAAEYVPKPPKV